MHNSAGEDRRTRGVDLHVLYRDIVEHLGAGMRRGERGVCDVVSEEPEGGRDGDRMVDAREVVRDER